MKYFKKTSFLFCCILALLLAGCKPVVTINEPANRDTFEAGETITFEGTATDLQHPNLDGDAFVWASDLEGKIGTGASIESSDLSEGDHTITLTVKDPVGQIGQSSVTITIGTGGTSTTTIAATGARFKDNNNGTITNTRTKLIWLKNANPDAANANGGLMTWADAGTYCSNLKSGIAGLTDGSTAGQWRLPTVQELEGIGTDPSTTYCIDDPACTGMSCPVTWTMPGAPFTSVQSYGYWSGTSYTFDTDYAWYVYMSNGVVNYLSKSNYLYVWPVRDNN